jgi:Fe-S-cluster-containing dehydrogenase component
MALVVHACETCCVITKSGGQSTWIGVAKWKTFKAEVDHMVPMKRRRETVTYSSVICNLFRESTCMQHCIPAGYRASMMARKLHRWLSTSGITTPLKMVL